MKVAIATKILCNGFGIIKANTTEHKSAYLLKQRGRATYWSHIAITEKRHGPQIGVFKDVQTRVPKC